MTADVSRAIASSKLSGRSGMSPSDFTSDCDSFKFLKQFKNRKKAHDWYSSNLVFALLMFLDSVIGGRRTTVDSDPNLVSLLQLSRNHTSRVAVDRVELAVVFHGFRMMKDEKQSLSAPEHAYVHLTLICTFLPVNASTTPAPRPCELPPANDIQPAADRGSLVAMTSGWSRFPRTN